MSETFECYNEDMPADLKTPPKKALGIDPEGYNAEQNEYVATDSPSQDPSLIILHLMQNAGIPSEHVAQFRYCDFATEIGDINISKGDVISIAQSGPNGYQINIGEQIITLYPEKGLAYNISNPNQFARN